MLKIFLQTIFSVQNIGKYKVICILGIKIKFNKIKSLQRKISQMPIQKNKIVFSNFTGKSYGCNPKYIAQEIIRQNLPYELVWLVSDIKKEIEERNFPSQIRLVPNKCKEAFYELATAKVWVDNQRKNYYYRNGLVKKNNQCYIQTWHGSFGIKKIEQEMDYELFPGFFEEAQLDSSYINYMLSNSNFDDNLFANYFWFNGPVIRTGHPRNDIFFKKEDFKQKIKQKLYDKYCIKKDKKLLIYIPTFRDNGKLYPYNLNIKKVLKEFSDKFNGEWCCLVRLHPRIQNISEKIYSYNENIIDASNYSDIQELLFVADAAISDYSSCLFDFIITQRPAFIYASDLQDFKAGRGFAYPLENSPFPIAEDFEELVSNIRNFNEIEYKNRSKNFLQKLDWSDDGHASEKVVEIIKKEISNI